MSLKFTIALALGLLVHASSYSQITLNAASSSNNGSGGIFLRLATNTTPITLKKFTTYFSSTSGTAVSVVLYSRSGDYAGFTASDVGWTLLGTLSATSAGASGLAPIDVAALNIQMAASTTTSFYLHSTTTGGGIRYNGTSALPPTTTYADANLELYSQTARTGTVAFGGTANSPRTFAGSVEYATNALPLKWLEAFAKNDRGRAELSWKVEEQHIQQFEVEKLVGNAYQPIATIASKGNGLNSYAYTDQNPFVGSTTLTCYRIKQKSLDGSISYSPVLVVKKADGKPSVSVYPNPTKGGTVQVTVAETQVATVTNIVGKQVATVTLNTGTNKVDVDKWHPGMYILKTENGEAIKIVKQ